jgi:hypothetical protein
MMMTTTVSWITNVFDDSEQWSWFREPLFDEEQVQSELEKMGISLLAERRQRHVRFRLTEPLTTAHCERLTELRAQGLFALYYLDDETSQHLQR